MYAKLVTLTVVAVVLAAGLLALRQERLRLSHELAAAQSQARRVQQQLWQAQADAAAMTTPELLEAHIRATQLAFEPLVPQPARPGPATRLVRQPDPQDLP